MPVTRARGPSLLVWGLGATVIVGFGALLYGFSVLVTDQAAGAEFSTTVLSGAFGGAVLTGGLAGIFVGRWADRRGVRSIVAIGSLAALVGMAGFAWARQPWQVLAAWWLVLGPAGAMVLYDPAFVALDQWFPRAERIRGIAALTFLGGLSGPIYLPATSALVRSLGWRPTALILGGAVAAVGLLTALVAIPPGRPLREETEGVARPIRHLIADRRFILFTAASFLVYGTLEAVLVHRVARFEESGFPVASVAAWAALAGILSFPGRYLLPRLAIRVQGTRLFALTLVVMAASLGLAVRGSATWEMVAHFLAFGLVFGSVIPLRAVVMSDWFSGAAFGRVMGAQMAGIAVFRAIAPAVTGALRDAQGSYLVPMALLTASVAVAAALMLAAEARGTQPR
ncbi:MAG: MFS transporter [Acidimicrobiia bacterium]